MKAIKTYGAFVISLLALVVISVLLCADRLGRRKPTIQPAFHFDGAHLHESDLKKVIHSV